MNFTLNIARGVRQQQKILALGIMLSGYQHWELYSLPLRSSAYLLAFTYVHAIHLPYQTLLTASAYLVNGGSAACP